MISSLHFLASSKSLDGYRERLDEPMERHFAEFEYPATRGIDRESTQQEFAFGDGLLRILGGYDDSLPLKRARRERSQD